MILSRSPQGERGLKYFAAPSKFCSTRRSPQGERGLKLVDEAQVSQLQAVALRKESVD